MTGPKFQVSLQGHARDSDQATASFYGVRLVGPRIPAQAPSTVLGLGSKAPNKPMRFPRANLVEASEAALGPIVVSPGVPPKSSCHACGLHGCDVLNVAHHITSCAPNTRCTLFPFCTFARNTLTVSKFYPGHLDLVIPRAP